MQTLSVFNIILISIPQARNILVHPEQFSLENGLLTPTFKNKRPAFEKKFAEELETLYADSS